MSLIVWQGIPQNNAKVAGIYHIDCHVRSLQSVAQQFAPLRLVPQPRKVAPKPVGTKR
jgi:hypothetical protein